MAKMRRRSRGKPGRRIVRRRNVPGSARNKRMLKPRPGKIGYRL